MLQPNRTFSADESYRYGFNGKENEDEVEGLGNEVVFENRIYDPRISRWFSLDPHQKKYLEESNYSFVSGNPIIYADKDGRDRIVTITWIEKNGHSKVIHKTYSGPTYYSYADVPGFGNNRYYKQDVVENVTVDLRGATGTVTYSEKLGDQKETGFASYYWGKLTNSVNDIIDTRRSSQPGGITMTSQFTTETDPQKTDATKGSSESINIDLLLASGDAIFEDGEPQKTLQELVKLSKDIVELHEQSKEKSQEETPEPTLRQQKKVTKDTTYVMYSEPGVGNATSVKADAEALWADFRKKHPNSKQSMKTFTQKGTTTTNE